MLPAIGDADLVYRLRALGMGGVVLHIGAHPDDEDTGTLVYLSRGLSVRTVYWSATRGEGGQNRIGPQRDEALGILRTWESLSAREIDGGEVLYGPFYDFGFSKSGDDALARWGSVDVVREIVRAIRLVQPLVVISRWSGGPEDGHGQHQAIGLVAAEAFEAAGDAGRFPELERQDLSPWQPRKLYRSLGRDWQPGEDVALGTVVAEYEDQRALRINTGAVEQVSGRTYQELAALTNNRHQSQAMGFIPERGDFFYYYRLERSSVSAKGKERSFFDGLDPTLPGIAEGVDSDRLTKLLDEARQHADAAVAILHPHDRTPAGEEVLQGLDRVREARESLSEEDLSDRERRPLERYLDRKVHAFADAAARCFGITLECLVDQSRATSHERLRVATRLWKGTSGGDDSEFRIAVPPGWAVDAGRSGERRVETATVTEAEFEVAVPENAALSSPYWLRSPRTPYRYVWPEDGPLGLPFDPPLVEAVADVSVRGRRIEMFAPAVHREPLSGGFREVPLAVLPPIALVPKERRLFLPVAGASEPLELHITARCMRRDGATGPIRLLAPDGCEVFPSSVDLDFAKAGDAHTIAFEVRIKEPRAGVLGLQYMIESDGAHYAVDLNPVWRAGMGIPGAPNESNAVAEAFVMLPAAVSIHVLDVWFVPSLRVGYVSGADEDILRSLERFGLDVSVLSEQDLFYGALDSFDVVVVGPNAYLMRPDLRKAASRLLDYVDAGGTLVVQYQGYGYQEGRFAPFPFRFNQPHDRVTLPDAPVEILEPHHPVVNLPNELTDADFDGWVHDKGLYFFGEWDRRYMPILASNDPGENSKHGGLLVANYGRGTFVYCGYSLFRQIPAGVPGGFKLFANFLGLAEARIQERRELVRGIPLFSFMNDGELYRVAKLMSERWINDGEYLSKQGDRGKELYLVLDGELEVVKDVGGESRVLGVSRKGEATGILGALADMPRTASLRARGDAKVLVLRADHLQGLMSEHPDLAQGIIRTLAKHLAAKEG